MKLNKYIIPVVLLAGCIALPSCNDRLDIGQHGVTTVSNFYQTDADAEEAITACYDAWKGTFQPAFTVKNLISDDVNNGGESWSAGYYQLSTYTYDAGNSNISSWYQALYRVIYRANVILENIPEDATSAAMKRARAEAHVFRAMAYLDLIPYWGTPVLVDHVLSAAEYSSPNGNPTELWALVESDLTTAISGGLDEKSSANDWTYRVTKGFAQALLGKAYILQKKWSEAASILETLIGSGKYELESSMEDLMTLKGEESKETLFESNYVYDQSQSTGMANMLWVYVQWRGGGMWDHTAEAASKWNANGWGFFNPTEEIRDAFLAEEGADGYRYNCYIKDLAYVNSQGITLMPSIEYCPDHCGLFDWKYRAYTEGTYQWYFMLSPNNLRYMRYAEVLLYAAEANLMAGNQAKADTYLNMVRSRAKLGNKTATMDAIKTERQLELWCEGVRYQDLVRWGDAAKVLANRGKSRPYLMPDGTVNHLDYSTTGFVSGKHDLLPFPTSEINSNPNLVQNPGW
ncbi:MAG: RagB/SusD family nutrient uptake outer membrane protein [Bacteroidaceae bacterium]|nr:RagB/SusD family nutrient uptake outer membrane protein [Bacteroidaceae bacterium]